jgi:hypothetical protein
MTDSTAETGHDDLSMVRNTLTIGTHTFLLAQNLHIDELKRSARHAVAAGDYIDFVVVGNRTVSALLSAGVTVVFESYRVEFDARDTGDTDFPYEVPGTTENLL